MERAINHQWEKDHPASEPLIPPLLQRLSNPESCKPKEPLPLRDRLSSKLKPLLSRLGQVNSKNCKPSSKSVRSLQQSQLEMNISKPTHSSSMQPYSMESRPTLLSRMNMETDSSTPHSESVRDSLVMEVSDMKNLTGIMLEPLTQSMSTTSLVGYPRESPLSWEMTIPEEGQAAIAQSPQTAIPEIEVVPTKSKGFMNPKCHGSVRRNDLESRLQTPVVSRPKILSTSSKETLLPSKGGHGSGVPQVLQPDFPAQNGMRSSKERPSTLIPSSVLSTTSIALTKVSDVLDLLKSSLEDRSPRRRLKRAASGPLRSILSLKQLRSSSPTDTMSSGNMGTTWKNCSLPNQSPSIPSCSNMTKQLGTRLDKDKISSSLIKESSSGIMKPSSRQTVSELKERVEEVVDLQEKAENLKKNLISAIGSMERTDAVLPPRSVSTSIYAKNANSMDMEKWTAK